MSCGQNVWTNPAASFPMTTTRKNSCRAMTKRSSCRAMTKGYDEGVIGNGVKRQAWVSDRSKLED